MTEHVRKLAMTPGEIKVRYMQAANRKAQIGVLAELNACSKQDIISVLKAIGVEIEKPKPRSYTVWSKEEEERLAELDKQGLSKQEIADAMGRNIKSIIYKLRDLRLKIAAEPVSKPLEVWPTAKEMITPKVDQPGEMQAAVEKEEPMKRFLDTEETGKAPSVDESEKRQQKNWTPDEEHLLLDLVDKGYSHQAIGEELHRSAGSVKHKLKYMKKDAKVAELEAQAQTMLSSEAFSRMLMVAIGNELPAGSEARLSDIMAAIGTAVLQYFSAPNNNGLPLMPHM